MVEGGDYGCVGVGEGGGVGFCGGVVGVVGGGGVDLY